MSLYSHSVAGLRLRPCTSSDVDVLNTWVTDDADLRRFAGPGLSLPLTLEQLAAPADDTCVVFAVTDDASDLAIGHAQLRGIDRVRRSCRIARLLIDPELRGRGLGGELVRALMAHASSSLGIVEITLNVYIDNIAAVSLYERCGFEFTGRSASVPDAGAEMRYVLPARSDSSVAR